MGGRLVHTMALLAQVARVAQLIRALSSACVDGQRLADSAVPASSCTFGAEAPVLLLATTRGSNLVSENPTSAVSDNDGVVNRSRTMVSSCRTAAPAQAALHPYSFGLPVSWADLAASSPGGRVGQFLSFVG